VNEETVDSFSNYIIDSISSSIDNISNFDDLKQRFRNYFNIPISENEERILADRYPSIIKEINERKESDITRRLLLTSQQQEKINASTAQ
jgi:hypothetical protein